MSKEPQEPIPFPERGVVDLGRKDAIIPAPTARAFLMAGSGALKHLEPMSVQDAEAIDKALGDPENSHHCPLCNNFFGTEAFIRHAPGCIKARAPRRRFWFPDPTKPLIPAYPDVVHMEPGEKI